MLQDVQEWINDNPEIVAEGYKRVYDTLWTEDSVTGKASGSYTIDRWQAGEYVCSNMGLAVAAFREFSDLKQFAEKVEAEEWEFMDVTIRCYLLGQVLTEAFEIRGLEI